ncbi:winged helix-turn-helix domain-containing protein [Gracilibacillus suaedae]|uniref:winged helix-turn-helix domain-containing protein n=1 Tax=Gracilibacillus suaedae TaxID=2820273 RepID=UPI001ABE5DB3|nr:winged helix-turn-helix domain-containing protein [Gracilibacillus suaedae]
MFITLINEDERTLQKLRNLLTEYNFNFVYVNDTVELPVKSNNVSVLSSKSLKHMTKSLPFYYKFHENIILDVRKRSVYRKKENLELPLSTIEYEIICLLLENLNSVVTTDRLLDQVWGIDTPVGTDNLYVYINRLRKKIEPYPKYPSILITHRRYGYELKRMDHLHYLEKEE